MKQESERFFTSELPYLLTAETGHILLGGNFNCMLEAAETTGGFTYSRALAEFVHGMEAIVATFSDNLAVCLRISVHLPILRRGAGYRKWTAL
jgi:hypothetical protein